MMKTTLTLCLSLCGLLAFPQKKEKESFYVFNANWKPTEMDSASYFLDIHEREDGNWQWDYYAFWGPLIKVETYAQHDGGQLNGRAFYYAEDGSLDSIGRYDHGKKEGSFYKLDHIRDSIRWVRQYIYHQDILERTIDLLADSNERKAQQQDSINNRESEYPGGIRSWIRFLTKNLKYPDRARSRGGEGTVRICFIVDADGNVQEPFLQKSREYSLDLESLRIINRSGKWIPGRKNGEIVKTYKVQPIVFRLQ
jgi:protein TonB